MVSFKEQFNHFPLGVPGYMDISKSPTKKIEKTISLEKAISAVYGNALTKLIARLKLVLKREWFNEKNIANRVSSHNFEDLKNLTSLFNKAYPDSSKINKKVSHFMDHFVTPAFDLKARQKFIEGLTDSNQKCQVEDLLNIDYISKCLEKNIKAIDLVNMDVDLFHRLIDAKNEQDFNEVIKNFLGQPFLDDIQYFTTDLDLQDALFIRMPTESRQLIRDLTDNGITVEQIFATSPTAKEVLDFIHLNSEKNFYEDVSNFVPQTSLQIGLLKSPANSAERLLIPILVKNGQTAKDLTGTYFSFIEDIVLCAKDYNVQKSNVIAAMLNKIPEESRKRHEHTLEVFFDDPFNQDTDLALVIPLIDNFDTSLAELIEEYCTFEGYQSFEKLKKNLNGMSLLDKIKQEYNNSKP
ncbi:hypothetical protein [Parachlamydia acanthamoebae]|uniref:hypothetical protein n=1 Tax=Parachlamydia acanthamoebae TaxID=83552 RepID=UPI0007510213|nr:hypothetical protein [Parachlamydia acanthamoebae]